MYRVIDVRNMPGAARIRAALPCGCAYKIIVPGDPGVPFVRASMLSFSPSGRNGCSVCRPGPRSSPDPPEEPPLSSEMISDTRAATLYAAYKHVCETECTIEDPLYAERVEESWSRAKEAIDEFLAALDDARGLTGRL